MLERWERVEKDFLPKFLENTAAYLQNAAQALYKGGVTVSVVATTDGYDVVAQTPGLPNVVFMEFGTGAYTTDLGQNWWAWAMPFIMEPGSWSEWHKRTWQKHIEKGGTPESYRYNTMPTHALERAFDETMANLPQIANDTVKELLKK